MRYDKINELFSNLKNYSFVFFFNGLISLSFVLILLFYTHGNLLFDGDNYGFYHLNQSALINSPTGCLEYISLLFSFGNIYSAFYIYVFISIFISTSSIYFLAYQTYGVINFEEKMKHFILLVPILYIIVPYVLVDYYNTFLSNISLSSSLFILFMAFLLKFYWKLNSHSEKSKFDLIMSAMFLGLSVTPYPNDVRIMLLGYAFFISILIIVFISKKFIKTLKNTIELLSYIFIFIFLSAIFSFFMTYSILFDLPGTLSNSSVASNNFPELGFYTGSFNTIIWVIRLLGSWSFPTGFVVYHSAYFGFNLVNISSFLWPVLAIVVPIVSLYKRDFVKEYKLFITLIALILSGLFWEKGANEPLGFIWSYINIYIPFGYELIPTGTITYLFLSKFYPIMAVFSIMYVYVLFLKIARLNKNKIFSYLPRVITLLLVIILFVAASPVFDGQLEENYFNTNSSGFIIPSEYNEVRAYLINHTGNSLLLPGTQPYITTNWNLSVSSYFYNVYFSPANVITNQNYGGGYASSISTENYINLTSPVNYTNNTYLISSLWINEVKNLNISFILVDFSFVNGSTYKNYTYINAALQVLSLNKVIIKVFTSRDLILYKFQL